MRITRSGPGVDETLLAAQLGQGWLYRDENGEPVARASDGSIVFDQDVLSAAIAQKTDEEASTRTAPKAAAETETKEDNGSKLCPDPGPDVPHGASERAKAYQEQISALNNPQRPLPRGIAVSFFNPQSGKNVTLDDCRESDGAMIEAKGPGFADMLKNDFLVDRLTDEWTDQARSQVAASQWRSLEWFFAEQEAADRAKILFSTTPGLEHIIIHLVPPEVK